MTSNPDAEALLSVRETSKYLGISPATLNRMLKREEIEHYRVGNRILFSKEFHILPYLSRNEKKAKIVAV